MPKLIKLECTSPIAINYDIKTPWDDIWITTTVKPGRKKLRLAPCLIGKKHFESDYKWQMELAKKNEFFKKDLTLYKKIKNDIDLGKVFIYNYEYDEGIIDIYTPKESIDKKEAERLIGILLKRYGINSCKYKWKKPKMFIYSA